MDTLSKPVEITLFGNLSTKCMSGAYVFLNLQNMFPDRNFFATTDDCLGEWIVLPDKMFELIHTHVGIDNNTAWMVKPTKPIEYNAWNENKIEQAELWIYSKRVLDSILMDV
jgi:hypothetical protein